MRLSLLLIIIILTKESFSQQYTSSGNVRIPADQTTSTEAIAAYINQHYDSERSRIAAIFSWVSSNIKYDNDSANIINLGPDPEAKIKAALRRKKGVCENFAVIFNDICLKAGITSYVVEGYTKQNGAVDRSSHSWCVVLAGDEWQLCDPTWEATGAYAKWFMVPPAEMIKTHMPFDPMWQLLEYPVSHRSFCDGGYDKKVEKFNYTDTIASWIKLDSLDRYRSTAYRIQKAGLYNEHVKNRHEYTKMNIEIIREDKDVELYNSAVKDLNDATTIYNNFIQFRNTQFNPAIPDQKLESFLDGAEKIFLNAYGKLDEIERSAATFRFSTEDLRTRLNIMAAKVKEQKTFLKNYLVTPKTNRDTLFQTRQQLVGK